MNYRLNSGDEICPQTTTMVAHRLAGIIESCLRKIDSRHMLARICVSVMLVCMSTLVASAATYVVTSVNNSGAGSLRQAILDANANPGADLINFNIPGAGGHPIFLKTLLPVITDPVTIDGYSQPGATPNTATMADNATLLIELTGTDPFFFNAGDALVITAGSSTVKGLIINGFTNAGNSACGIRIMSKGGNVISGNFIGTNASGFSAIPNTLGIYMEDSPNNTIGGNTPGSRNVISGNVFSGVKIVSAGSMGNRVIGNFIGTNRNGTAAVPNRDGVDIEKMGTGSSNTHVGGTLPGEGNLISGNLSVGITTFGGVTDLTIQGNLIGTDVSGKVALGNGAHGIGIGSTGSLTVIGGSSAGARNIISGNKYYGVVVDHDASLVVQGNYIGTDITGKVAVGNAGTGLVLYSSYNTVGGSGAGEGNVISGNGDAGVYISGSITTGTTGSYNFVLGNLIGIGADGTTPLGNKTIGVWIYTSTGTNNVIGGQGTARNSIAFNGAAGVDVASGTANLISGNSITANGGLGIELNPVGAAANDAGDADTGPNNLQNYPVLTAASLISNGLTTVDATLNSAANTKFTVEFFANDAADPSGFGEGQVYLGAVSVTTNASGNVSFTGTFAGLSAGKCISATAIDPALNTSEFSQCKLISLNSPGALQFSSAVYSVNENGGPATVTVKRVGGNFGTVSVQYATVAGGTAAAGSDYTTVSGTLIWGHGDAADKTFTIPIVDDSAAESNETVNLALSNATNGTLPGSPTAAVLTINDNESQPTISISDVSQVEGNSGTANFAFTVSLSATSSQTVSVNYTTADNSAQSGSDYQAANGLISFAPGETSKPINVSVNGDTQVEPDEKFIVNVSNAVNAIIGKGQGTGTIVNDDAPATPAMIQLEQPGFLLQEDLGSFNVTVIRTGDTSAAASVDYTTVDGSATQKADFEYAAGTLQFLPGETSKTFQVILNEDSYVEGTESFNITLSNPVGGILGQSTAPAFIADDATELPANPIDDAGSFVQMHYHDFLNREPDPAGLAFWTSQITSCGNDAKCIEEKRVNVSASFFLSIEFQETGYLLYLMQKESYATRPTYASFMRDLQEVSRGVIVNAPGWQQKLADNQQQFADKWINRAEFKAAYDALSNDAYVNALHKNAGIVAPQVEKDKLVTGLNTASMNRSSVLLEVAENATFREQEQNGAFVLMEYFGYLRRDPQASPDSDLSGYNFWLSKLNQFNGNYIDAEMIKAFITSFEYRQRFGQ